MNFTRLKFTQLRTDAAVRTQNLNFLDLVKFICAALVVAVHVPPLADTSTVLNFAVVNYAARVAVPMFFVSASYFVFLKAFDGSQKHFGINTDVLIKYAARIFRLYVIWTLIYLPFVYLYMYRSAGEFHFFAFSKTVLKDFVFSSAYGHLWYLNAICQTYLLIVLMLKAKIKPPVIAAFAFIMYLLGLTTQSWYGLFEPILSTEPIQSVLILLKAIFKTARSALCEGLLFTLMGMFFAKYRISLKLKYAYVCFAVSAALYASEVLTLVKHDWIKEYDMFLGLIPTVFFMFYICINIKLPDSRIYIKLRNTSALIYFSHMLFAECLLLIPALSSVFPFSFTRYLFAYICSLLLSFAILKLSDVLPFMKKLYK